MQTVADRNDRRLDNRCRISIAATMEFRKVDSCSGSVNGVIVSFNKGRKDVVEELR